MARTKAELAVEVAERLNAVGAGESLSAEDRGTIYRGIDASLAYLASRRVVYVSNPDAVPEEVFQPLAAYIAEQMAPKFGRATDEAAADVAISNIRATRIQALTNTPARPDYF